MDKMPQTSRYLPPIVFLMITIKRNNWTPQVLPSKYESSPAGASDLRREDLAPRASRHDRGGTEFLFFTSGPFEGARFFFLLSSLAAMTVFVPKAPLESGIRQPTESYSLSFGFQGGSSTAALQDSKAAASLPHSKAPYDAAEPKIFFLPASQLAMALLKYE